MKRMGLSELMLLGGQVAAGFGAAIALIYSVWRVYQSDAQAFVEAVRSLEIGLANLSLAFFIVYLWPRLRAANRPA